jgi:hypothetical protein
VIVGRAIFERYPKVAGYHVNQVGKDASRAQRSTK